MVGAAISGGEAVVYKFAEGVGTALAELRHVTLGSTQSAIVTVAQSWLQAHPLLQWVFAHPLLSIGIAIVIVFLLGGLFQAIGRLTEQIWVFLLQAPFRLVRWLWSLGGRLIGLGGSGVQTRLSLGGTAKQSPVDPQTRLTEILTQLDTLRQEQDKLLDEVKTLLIMDKK